VILLHETMGEGKKLMGILVTLMKELFFLVVYVVVNSWGVLTGWKKSISLLKSSLLTSGIWT
jgi:hypothetical protein